MDSKELRAQILKKRQSLSPQQVAHLSEQVFRQFQKQNLRLSPEGNVALYRTLPGEVQLKPWENYFLEQGWNLHYPRITDLKGGKMEFFRVESPQVSSFQPGPMGIEEPRSQQRISPTQLDLLLVPGLAFGPLGERTGFGRGFYDRYLPQVRPSVPTVGLAFDFQMIENLPQNPWDQKVHVIVTETRFMTPHGLENLVSLKKS